MDLWNPQVSTFKILIWLINTFPTCPVIIPAVIHCVPVLGQFLYLDYLESLQQTWKSAITIVFKMGKLHSGWLSDLLKDTKLAQDGIWTRSVSNVEVILTVLCCYS